jgi:hypothetical protein
LGQRERDHDEGAATWRNAAKDGDAIGGAFLNGEFQPDPDPVRAAYPDDAIFSPAPELRRQHDLAFNQSGRASASPPAPKPGRFHPRSLRRFQP